MYTIFEGRWYVNAEDGYEYLINIKTHEVVAKRDKKGNILPL